MPRLTSPRTRSAQSPLETYLREINETPLLSAEEERDLAYRIEEGDSEARDHLVRANLRLVVNIARRYAQRFKGLSLQDLIEEGNIGLMRAVEGFDASMNTRFSTYACFWIKQSMKRAHVNTAKTVRIPAYMVELLSKWRRETARLQEELGRTPTEEEIATALHLKKKSLAIIRKAIRIYNSGSQFEQTDPEFSISATLIDDNCKAPDTGLAAVEDLHQVQELLRKMDEREAAVLRLRYGLEGGQPLTLNEIGERLGLTRERIRQIEKDALIKLREQLEAA
jgi:RNA polymerase primary sigma factor